MRAWFPGGRARRWVAASIVLACAAGSAWSQEPAAAGGQLSVEEVEQIVREYLLREPEIIYQALEELQRREQVAAAERQRQAVIAHREQLLNDPASPVAGNPEGDVTLVEFFDYRCQFCRRVVSSMRALLEEDDDLRIVFKELPVLGEDSVRAARAALASRRQDGYVPFHFALMQANHFSEAAILELAASLGLDARQLARDMHAPEIQRAIEDNYQLASRLGVEGTPAFVIGDRLIPGAVGKDRLEELIEEARAG